VQHADSWHEADTRDTSPDEADTILEELEHGDVVIVRRASRAGAGAPRSNSVADLALSPLRAGVCVSCVCAYVYVLILICTHTHTHTHTQGTGEAWRRAGGGDLRHCIEHGGC
jgi:hypothetical protein